MSERVVATPAAETSARKMSAILTGDITTRLHEIRHLGQVLSRPGVWDGPDADVFRGEHWPHASRGIDQAVQQMERLADRSRSVLDHILRAGGEGTLTGGAPPHNRHHTHPEHGHHPDRGHTGGTPGGNGGDQTHGGGQTTGHHHPTHEHEPAHQHQHDPVGHHFPDRPAPTAEVRGWIGEAMKLAHVPRGWEAGLATIIAHESSNNPDAINRWDSNAREGHPSQGLMQLIPSTFATYHEPGTSHSITDPVANIAAGINYIRARYGDISHVPGLVSLARGGPYVGY